jgi:hypothetical protein
MGRRTGDCAIARVTLGLWALLFVGPLPACGNTSSAVDIGPSAALYSTQTGQNHGSVNFSLDTAPPFDYFVGAWTHVVPPESGGKGNDYPFSAPCKEGEVSFVSGNIGPSEWAYNTNIMLFDTSQNYLGDFTLVFVAADYATDVDWVYVGWHFRRSSGQTSVTQYVKFIGSANLVDNKVTETVPGIWTPTALQVGGDPSRYPDTTMYIMYASLYATDVPPTDEQLNAIYTRGATPDPSAWAAWPLDDGNPADVSGHGHDLTVHGPVARGVQGPKLP